ncbi:PEP-CTERM sorting domain-containing protein [Tautonia rosea]|uniref:PEP-CTERM sorting domain-containing protein n=1 Tax=Tautonia rosea TaxID=2728037 RepID=UPI001473F9B4|nr:PEP-CTERM sorting domain-containing protein [Tautonia rosea]
MSTLMEKRLRNDCIRTAMTVLMASLFLGEQAEGAVIRSRVEQRLVTYSTSTTLGNAGEPPVTLLEFNGVGSISTPEAPGGMFSMPGVFSLGTFTTKAVPSGMSVLLDRFPFSITLNLFGNSPDRSVVSQIAINGTLDGVLSTAPGTGLIASVSSVSQIGTPIGTPPFRVEDLQILAPQFIMPAGSSPSMNTPIFGYVNAQVPEPTALATLGVGIAVWLLRRKQQARRVRMEVTA